jgi:hypothetical protein
MVVRDVVVTVPESWAELVVIWASQEGYRFLLDSLSQESSSRKGVQRGHVHCGLGVRGYCRDRATHVCGPDGGEGVGCGLVQKLVMNAQTCVHS